MYELNSKAPIENGLIFLTKDSLIYDLSITDKIGNYCFNNVKLDSFSIRTMRYGYIDIKTGPFIFNNSDTFRLFIELEVTPISMEPIIKIDEKIDPQLERIGFYQRKEEGSGYCYTKEDIEQTSVHQISDFFNRIPGIVVGKSGFSSYITSTRYKNSSIKKDYIPISVYIDGAKLYMDSSTQIDINIVDPQHIKAIEVYPSSARAPAIYGGMADAGGVILIWTGR